MENIKNVSWNVVYLVEQTGFDYNKEKKEICLCSGKKNKMSTINSFLYNDSTKKMLL